MKQNINTLDNEIYIVSYETKDGNNHPDLQWTT